MKNSYAPDTVACSVAPRDSVQLRNIHSGLQDIREHAFVQVGRLQKAMDYILGEQPATPVGGLTAGRSVGGVTGDILETLDVLRANLDSVDDQINRLERIVG